MAYDNTLTLVGNMTRDPELTFIASGSALCKFSIADNQKKANGEEVAHFFDCVAWSDLAENIAESFSKGQRVIVHGRLKQDRWENENGENRQKVEITVEDAGHALKWATSVATKNAAPGKQREAPRLDPKPVPEVEPF
jgi:single-strand DNA-binding protein